MNPATSWEGVMAQVHQDDTGKWDAEVAAADLHMDDRGMLALSASTPRQTLRPSDLALTQLCGKLELPARYLKRIPSELRARCVNHDLAAAALDGRRFLVRAKGEMARAFLSDKYSRVNNVEFLETFEKLSRGFQHQVRSFAMTETGMWMKILVDDLRSWDPSDISSELKVGLLVGNSETGCRSVTVEAFLYRKACTNDAIFQAESALDARHVNLKPRELRLRIAEAMNAAIKGGDEALQVFVQSYEETVANPADVIKELAAKRGLTQEQTDQVQLAYQVEPMATRFGVIGAFTRAAQAMEADVRVDLERFAGGLLMDREACCLAA